MSRSAATRRFSIFFRERVCLIALKAGCVEEFSKENDSMILKLRFLEEERLRLAKEFGSSGLTLQALGELTGNAVFLDIRSKLASC